MTRHTRSVSGRSLSAETVHTSIAGIMFFSTLVSTTILRPVREEMGVRFGVENMHWLFTATFVATVLVAPLFGRAASRLRRGPCVSLISLTAAACLIAFHIALRTEVTSRMAAPVFFVWLSVFNIFSVSVFWSVMTDVFAEDAAKRRFGHIAAGGTAGAVAGPAFAAVLAPRFGTESLLLVASLFVVISLGCALRLLVGATKDQVVTGAIGGRALDGVRETARSPMLLGMSLITICYSALSTILYFAQAELVREALSDSAERTALFARVDLIVNVLTVLMQTIMVAPLVRRFGVSAAFCATSVVAVAGFFVLAIQPALGTLLLFQIVYRSTHYAFTRPSREVLFIPLDASIRYKAKNFIDTTVFRSSDAVSAWILAACRTAGIGLVPLASAAVPIALLWTLVASTIARARPSKTMSARV